METQWVNNVIGLIYLNKVRVFTQITLLYFLVSAVGYTPPIVCSFSNLLNT